jgi:predicted dehydrogenase
MPARPFFKLFSAPVVLFCFAAVSATAAPVEFKIGLIGLDSSHCVRFARMFNDPADKEYLGGARIVCAFKGGSPDLEMSRTRIEGFTATVSGKYGVAIVDTIAEVVARSDGIMILSVDGRAHLPQAREAFKAGKPVFIDKPFAGSLAQGVAIARLARELRVPVFSSSNLRYAPGVRKVQAAKIGEIRAVITHGPAAIESTVPDFLFYGIHATEALFAVLGAGCDTVTRIPGEEVDVIAGKWNDGRTGMVYGLRGGSRAWGITAFGSKGVIDDRSPNDLTALAPYILEFLRTGKSPVPLETTLEILAFMEAADESKRRGGVPVKMPVLSTLPPVP